MVNPEKIMLMSKLAIYEKRFGEKDKKVNEFYRHDYVYWSNFWTRLGALFGSLVLVGFYCLNLVFSEGADIFNIDYLEEGYKIAIFIVIILAIYTFLNSMIASKRYSTAQQRIKKQLSIMRRLDALNHNENPYDTNGLAEGETLVYHGSNIRNTRSSNREL